MVDSLIITSSVVMRSQPVSYYRLFSVLPVADVNYYDEGPQVPDPSPTTSLSGAMDTSAIDPFVQGVEISRQSQYDAGLAKIWSGEPGHKLLKTGFGMDKNFFPDPGFVEMDLFNPVRYLRAQEVESPLWFNTITFPIVTGDNDQLENFNFNGIIEPLTIRPIVAFFSTESPFESHTVRGSLGGGNMNQLGGSDQILSVDNFEPGQEAVGYLDMVDMFEGRPLNGFFRHEFTAVLPFNDERLVRNLRDAQPTDIAAALSLMTGSTGNYIGPNQRSNTCGWYYDGNAGIGTDSLAFGGMTH
jgi:hypothetical protein